MAKGPSASRAEEVSFKSKRRDTSHRHDGRTSSRSYPWGKVGQRGGQDHCGRGERGLRSQDTRKDFYLNIIITKRCDSRNIGNSKNEPGAKMIKNHWGDVHWSITTYNSHDMETASAHVDG